MTIPCSFVAIIVVAGSVLLPGQSTVADEIYENFFDAHCYECHDEDSADGNLDLTLLPRDFSEPAAFAQWVKVFDRIESGEMPPKKKERPSTGDRKGTLAILKKLLLDGEQKRIAKEGRTPLRRLTRVEYENTIRDLFDMPGLGVKDRLPADGLAHGFDKNSAALSISHVNMAKYIEAADYILDCAIATQPEPPTFQSVRYSLASGGGVRLMLTNNGSAVYLKDKKPDPEFPSTTVYQHVDRGAHERLNMYDRESAVGIFRSEDDSFRPAVRGFAAIYPGRYRIRTSLWSYTWDRGEVKASRGVEAARLSVLQLQGNGRGGGHPSYVIGYFDAPSLESQEHEFVQWLNSGETIGYNVGSLALVHIYHQYKRNASSFTGPGIACDYVDIEGPIHDAWPPAGHQLLFGDLPLSEFDPKTDGANYPVRVPYKQKMTGAKNRQDEAPGNWTVHSDAPGEDARKLLATFLPKAFRSPVEPAVINAYAEQVQLRLEAGDCFELAMRWAYRAALCSPDFLYHVERSDTLDDAAFANRLSYFLWNTKPDERLSGLASEGAIREPDVLKREVERLLADREKSERFVKEFVGQWLRLREISATSPDRKLYPEFSTYLKNSMIAETEAYFRELVEKDLDASHLIDSDFAMLNEKLAVHYGIKGVSGSGIRRVDLPAESLRGGFLTQASLMKITANGTTTSPVPRGAFVMDRLLGVPPDPPPENVSAIEPDLQGATTIRELLEKHRESSECAGCHAKMDPVGFALESFDVIGGFRKNYRTVDVGEKGERGAIDPFINIHFRVGPEVDSSYHLPDGRAFNDVNELRKLLLENPTLLLTNVARQLATYSTGREMTFSDRDPIAKIVTATEQKGGGIRTLIHELIQSELFDTR